MKTKLTLFILMLFSAFTFLVSSQDYDVLPVEGRNKLFNEYLLSEFDSVIIKRKKTIKDAMLSKENVLEYQSQLYKNFVPLFGEFPEKLPLNAEIVGTVSTNDGYHIEKILYQSRQNHHITANLYIPETGTAPYPTVVVLCGHYPVAKSYSDYQNLSILLAKNGIAAFIIDPICQGERYQFHDSEGKLTFVGTSGTSSLSKLDVGASMNGSSVASHLLWDNRRGLDYLYTRTDVVDTSKIGCTGHSGGGAQATNLLAFDKRLKAGAVANYLSNETRTFKELGPQVAPQNLAFEGVFGFDQASYIELFAPKPFMIIATTTDFFPIEGARETFAEVQPFYDTLGAKEKVTLFETQDVHDYTKIKREAAVRWFKRWFTGNNDTVIEANQNILPADSLNVTSTGLVYTNFPGEMTVQDINLEIALSDSVNRKDFWANNTKDSCLNMVKHLIRLKEDYEPPVSEVTETIDRGTYAIDKIKITSGNNVPVTGLLFKPKNLSAKAPATLYLDGDGKGVNAHVGGIIEESYVNNGSIVFAVDIRGFGETSDGLYTNDTKHGNNEFRNNMISLYLGKPLIGQRVEDIMKVVTVMLEDSDVDPDSISMEGLGRAATAALHAAALDTRIKSVILRRTIRSMIEHIEDPSIPNGMTHQVNSALKFCDLPDLVNAISPRNISFQKSNDASLRNIGVTGGTLSPRFSTSVFSYEVINLKSNEITITGYLKDENATFTGNDTYDVSSEGKTVELIVTAEDGTTTRTYTITIPMYTSLHTIDDRQNKNLLGQNYPNPFDNVSTIDYAIQNKGRVSIEILSIEGRKVVSLINEVKKPGNYEATILADHFEPGVYYYQLVVDGKIEHTKKLIVID